MKHFKHEKNLIKHEFVTKALHYNDYNLSTNLKLGLFFDEKNWLKLMQLRHF